LGRKELPASVRDLVARHFGSASDVDTLLLLFREDHGWTASTVARELRLNVDQAASILARLSQSGLLKAEGESYLFHPRDPSLVEAVRTLAELYPAYRFAVVSLIYPPSGSIRDFSDAFRLRKED
jgi:hypothetical protein